MEINGAEIEISKAGNKDNKSIVFIHGFPFDLTMWNNVIDSLKTDFYCVSYNIRGFGKSSGGDGQFTMEMFVDDLEEIIKKLKLNKPIICGLSMGGYITLRAIERFEKILGGLILCDTKAEPDSNEAKLKRAEGIKNINLKGAKNFAEEFIKNCFSEDFIKKNQNFYDNIVSNSAKTNPLALKGCLLAMAGRTDTTEYLSKIDIPTLILCGEKDNLSLPTLMKEMSREIKNAEFYIVPNAAHVIAVENPSFTTQKIRTFLNKLN
jgi:pimeloyl-ACP methyl ester carboxylesterase